MEILITGHMGFVGSHFHRWLELEGHTVWGVDIKQGTDCREWFKYQKRQFDLVIHCAAIVGGRSTIEGQPLSVATDLSIDADFFNWCKETKPKNVVYFSSSAAYPTEYQKLSRPYRLQEADIDLDAVKNPDLTYGWAKLTGEYLSQFLTDSKVFVFRPFSGYGSDQDTDYPFPSFIDRAIRRENPFVIWGDGNQVRDFIHIDDIVEAVLFHVDRGIAGTFNLCTGIGTSFNELARKVCQLAGYEPEFVHILDAPKGVEFRVGDPTLSHQVHLPEVSLEQGIVEALMLRNPLQN